MALIPAAFERNLGVHIPDTLDMVRVADDPQESRAAIAEALAVKGLA